MNFYFITDPNLTVNGMLSDVKAALEAGANVVQYRDKNASTRAMYETGRAIRQLCSEYGALYIVNDRLDIALATDADGVHIGQSDMPLSAVRKLMPNAVIGVSCASVEEASEAVEGGADYLGVGPIYATSTKADAGKPVGVETIRAIREKFDIPIVAIGGITLERVRPVIQAGADAVCAISATVGNNVFDNVKKFIEESRK